MDRKARTQVGSLTAANSIANPTASLASHAPRHWVLLAMTCQSGSEAPQILDRINHHAGSDRNQQDV